jgi:hypothetical protein
MAMTVAFQASAKAFAKRAAYPGSNPGSRMVFVENLRTVVSLSEANEARRYQKSRDFSLPARALDLAGQKAMVVEYF